ncbi:MAG TPA: GAF domain-containing protein [Anaeromyxobacteraceae bacterium]
MPRVADLEAVNALALKLFGAGPRDVQRVLASACKEIARALGAPSVIVLGLDEDGAMLRGLGGHGAPLPPPDIAIPLSRATLVTQALRTRKPVVAEDARSDVRSAVYGLEGHPPLAMLVLPLASREAARGVIVVGDSPPRRWTEAEVALAQAMAGLAAMGLENAELYAEAQRRVEELGLLLEVGRSLVASLDLDQVLDAGVRNLARIVGAPDAYLLLADESGERLVVRAATGSRPGLMGHAVALGGEEGALLSQVLVRREIVLVSDAEVDPRVPPALRQATGARAYLGLPLVVRERAIGAAAIVDAAAPRSFTPAEVERAAAIANQLAVAAEHARLYADLRRSYAELNRAQEQLVHRERLAALGELAAVVAHEVRNPLGVIFNSLAALRRLLRPAGDARTLLDIVGEEADRLNRIVGDLLDFARPGAPEFRPEAVDRLLDEVAQVALAQAAPGVSLLREIEPDLPPVPADARQLRQALLNVALNAVQSMPDGGTLALRARSDGDAVRLEIADSGPGVAEELRSRIFEPFFTTRASGTGLGLAVVRRVVDDHRGTVAVEEARGGRGAAFVIRLPLAGARPVENRPGLA